MLLGALPFEPCGGGSAGGVFVGSPLGGGASPAGGDASCGASAGGTSSGVLGAFWSELQAATKAASPSTAVASPWRNCRSAMGATSCNACAGRAIASFLREAVPSAAKRTKQTVTPAPQVGQRAARSPGGSMCWVRCRSLSSARHLAQIVDGLLQVRDRNGDRSHAARAAAFVPVGGGL